MNKLDKLHWAVFKTMSREKRLELVRGVGASYMVEHFGPAWYWQFPDEFDARGLPKMGGQMIPNQVEDRAKWTPDNIKVTERKVEKPPEPEAPAPNPVLKGQRFYKGHRIEYTKDSFCNMKCLNCGIEGRTYLTPFENDCEQASAHEYDYFC